jgi:hypothetical protein
MFVKDQNGERTVVINQPGYIPWLGFFEQIYRADIFVFLDCAQYVRQEWINRNRLKGTNGQPVWLTVPVENYPLDTAIKDTKILSSDFTWRKKHLKTISILLGGTAYIYEFLPQLAALYDKKHVNLCSFNIEIIKLISQWLGLSTEFILASELRPSGKRTDMLRDICFKLKATRYYSPAGASVYLEKEKHILEDAGIQVSYQAWVHPMYAQKFGAFLSHMSVLDAIMNIGPGKTKELIVKKNE